MSRARSAEVTMTQVAVSVSRQQSSRCSGLQIQRAVTTSCTVTRSLKSALGVCEAGLLGAALAWGIALRPASTAMARVERPEPREYSVSPTPTMQYLSRRWLIASPCHDRSRPASARRGGSGGSLAAAVRDGRRHAQSDVHTAGDPALARQDPR